MQYLILKVCVNCYENLMYKKDDASQTYRNHQNGRYNTASKFSSFSFRAFRMQSESETKINSYKDIVAIVNS